jgi:hypothetical protein
VEIFLEFFATENKHGDRPTNHKKRDRLTTYKKRDRHKQFDVIELELYIVGLFMRV